jgi:hypothetical protein
MLFLIIGVFIALVAFSIMRAFALPILIVFGVGLVVYWAGGRSICIAPGHCFYGYRYAETHPGYVPMPAKEHSQ